MSSTGETYEFFATSLPNYDVLLGFLESSTSFLFFLFFKFLNPFLAFHPIVLSS
jgi:hypothetical protein